MLFGDRPTKPFASLVNPCWHDPASCRPLWQSLRVTRVMTRLTRFIHVSSSPLFALELHVFPTDPPLASKMLRQLRCIEALESAIGILNAEYENVELVKGEVGKLKDPKGLDDDTFKKFQPYLPQTPVYLCSHVLELKIFNPNGFSLWNHNQLRLVEKTEEQMRSSTAACHRR